MSKSPSNLSSFGMVSMAGTVVSFVIAAALSLFLVGGSVDSNHRETVGQLLASELAQQINIKEAHFISQVGKIAASPLALDAINGSTSDAIEAEATIATMIPFAERVRLIPRGEAKTDQGFPPFTFIALDMVKSIEAGDAVTPEAISSQPRLEGEKWIILGAPVKSRDGSLRGTLFVYLSSSALTSDVTDGTKGQLTVMQMVGSEPRPIASAGNGGSASSFTIQLNNPKWTIQYSPSGVAATSAPGNIVFYLTPPLAMLIIALGTIFYSAGQTGSAIQRNLSRLGSQIARVSTGSYDNDVQYTLPGFADQDSKLKQFLEFSPTKSDDSKPVAKPQSKRVEPPPRKQLDEMVEIQMTDEADFEEVEEFEVDDFDEAVAAANQSDSSNDPGDLERIFRAYGIRGIVGESLSEDISRQIGQAIGSEAEARGQQTVIVGYDGREYSPALAEALIDGLTASGRDVINIGAVPTPVLYYATHNSTTQSGVMVTGSHNPPEYNGFKVVLDGKTLVDHEITALYERIKSGNLSSGSGSISEMDMVPDYMEAIADDVVVAQPLKVVVDCGNGIAGSIAPELLDSLGCEAVPLFCEVDGSFPNHHPDPTRPENLADLISTVRSQGADLGIGLDGDGDRLVAVTAEGAIVWPDRMLMLFAKDVVSRNPGSDVVYDVKCTRDLNSVISGFGGRPIISRSGHSFVKQKIAETGAMLGGELSGHICFSERWFGFDDGLYSAARLLEIVGPQEAGLSDLLAEFPESVSTPEIHVAIDDEEKFTLIEALIATADFEDATITAVDGLRVDFSDGWGLVRASNTEPALTLRFEADNEQALDEIKGEFRELLQELREENLRVTL
ncbi:MAG: phosphomannomutase/phosphoglucomutase [Pseudomonadales bacterium]|nr:phosphomannomutase/phosphoglucomutase [Pseudomonadales bacterium]